MGVQTIGLEAARGAAYSMAAMTDAKPAPGGSGEQISSTLGQLSAAELYEIMAQMKGMIQQNPPGPLHQVHRAISCEPGIVANGYMQLWHCLVKGQVSADYWEHPLHARTPMACLERAILPLRCRLGRFWCRTHS